MSAGLKRKRLDASRIVSHVSGTHGNLTLAQGPMVPRRVFMTAKKKRQLLLAGGFGLGAAVFMLVSPELGAIGAVGGIGMGVASAVTTMIAKH